MPSINSTTSFSLPSGQALIFELGGSGSVSVDGQQYTIGRQEAFLGPFDRAVSVVISVDVAPISYRIDADGDMSDQSPEIVALSERLDVVELASDSRGSGNVVYKETGTFGLTFSGGANTPALIENINGKVWVTTPVGQFVEITFPTITARLCPQTLYLEGDSDDWSKVLSASYYLASTGYAQFWIRGFDPLTTGNNAEPGMSGGGARKFWTDRSSLSNGGGSPDFSTTQVTTHKIRVTPVAGQSARICISKIVFDVVDVPSISITFDDGYTSVYANAFPLLKERGLKASWAIIADGIGSNASYATLANLQEWVAAGNECIPHGPRTGGSLNDAGSVSAAVSDMVYHRDYLINNGLSDQISANVYVWPQGVYFMGGNRRDISLREGAESAGFIGARGIELPQFFNSKVVGSEMRKWTVPIIGHSSVVGDSVAETANINTIISRINALATDGKSGCLMFHYVGANNGVAADISVANFTLLMNAIHSLVSRGQLVNPVFSRQVAWGGRYQ